MTTRIKFRHDIGIAWASNNPILALGEPGLEIDSNKVKYGDGVTAWNDLPYGGGGLSVGENGQIVIGNDAQAGDPYEYGNDDSIAIGTEAGYETQQDETISIGYQAGYSNQRYHGIAIGAQAGKWDQYWDAIAIGRSSGRNQQSNQTIAIGHRAGYNYQGSQSVAIGTWAGNDGQNQHAVSIGAYAGESNQGTASIAIGEDAGNNNQSFSAIAIGRSAGNNYQSSKAIAIGRLAGYDTQNSQAIAIGHHAGLYHQNSDSIAIGSWAGGGGDGMYSTGDASMNFSVTWNSHGNNGEDFVIINNPPYTVYPGMLLGSSTAYDGYYVDRVVDNENGTWTLYTNQNSDGQDWNSDNTINVYGGQRFHSVAIGLKAAQFAQHDHSIVINATGSNLPSRGQYTTVISPIRNVGSSRTNEQQIMLWDTATGEVTSSALNYLKPIWPGSTSHIETDGLYFAVSGTGDFSISTRPSTGTDQHVALTGVLTKTDPGSGTPSTVALTTGGEVTLSAGQSNIVYVNNATLLWPGDTVTATMVNNTTGFIYRITAICIQPGEGDTTYHLVVERLN